MKKKSIITWFVQQVCSHFEWLSSTAVENSLRHTLNCSPHGNPGFCSPPKCVGGRGPLTSWTLRQKPSQSIPGISGWSLLPSPGFQLELAVKIVEQKTRLNSTVHLNEIHHFYLWILIIAVKNICIQQPICFWCVIIPMKVFLNMKMMHIWKIFLYTNLWI